jgi:hypothetical protein
MAFGVSLMSRSRVIIVGMPHRSVTQRTPHWHSDKSPCHPTFFFLHSAQHGFVKIKELILFANLAYHKKKVCQLPRGKSEPCIKSCYVAGCAVGYSQYSPCSVGQERGRPVRGSVLLRVRHPTPLSDFPLPLRGTPRRRESDKLYFLRTLGFSEGKKSLDGLGSPH